MKEFNGYYATQGGTHGEILLEAYNYFFTNNILTENERLQLKEIVDELYCKNNDGVFDNPHYSSGDCCNPSRFTCRSCGNAVIYGVYETPLYYLDKNDSDYNEYDNYIGGYEDNIHYEYIIYGTNVGIVSPESDYSIKRL